MARPEGGARVVLAEGREAEVYLEPDGSVLKLWRDPGDGARRQHELAALAALGPTACRVPQPLATVEVDGRPGLVLERVEGTDLLTALGRRPLAVLAAARAMARVHAAMHEGEAPAELPDLHALVARRIEQAGALPPAWRDRSLDLLAGLPAGDRICHGDFHLGNMLGTWSDPVVIDWGDACRGDPVADVARSDLMIRLGEPPPGAPASLRLLARVGRGILVGRYLAGYRRRRPLDSDALDRWRTVRAAARLYEDIPEERPRLFRLLRRQLGDPVSS